jgi:alpha-N-arabinofuranosidase
MRNTSGLKVILIIIAICVCTLTRAQIAPANFKNPILPGFSPDPSICRVGSDYYLVNSSFVWFPGIPIYHSKDLVNWELIGHGITRPSQLRLDKIADKDGIWAVTIRYHDGLFYLIGTANNCGGNFLITAKDPAGEWSDPIWLKTPGIDASLFWDDDGKCYYSGNDFNFKKSWPAQCRIWTQEYDLTRHTFKGERSIQTYGYANNAASTEGPHIYKIDGKYLLLTAEGGTDYYHAITAHHSNTVLGPYVSDKINPVLSHRQLGKNYPIQAVGHGDLVQIQNGEWWAVVLGRRITNSDFSLTRETFLCKVEFEDGSPVFNPGYGRVLMEQQRPDLPWTTVKADPIRDEFDGNHLAIKWHFLRIPKHQFYCVNQGMLKLSLLPEVADSLTSPSLILQKLKDQKFETATKLWFRTNRENEQAGLIVYRNAGSYYMLLKGRSFLVLIRKSNGKKEIVAKVPYNDSNIYLKIYGNYTSASFSYGASLKDMKQIGDTQDMSIIAENKVNRFNGPGVGVYSTSNGHKTNNKAFFDWFEYKQVN